jgi:opacity protein-like surface antigen
MDRSTRLAVLASLVTLGLWAGSAAASTIVLPRAGQVGFGIQGQYGTLLSTGDLGKEFGSGAGLSVKVRYRMRFERAIGLTFDAERMNSRNPTGAAGAFDSLGNDPPGVLRDYMKMVTAGFEFYQMFDTRERTVKYLSAGAGLAQISAHLTDGEIQYPLAGDALFVSVGAGFERFFMRSWAWDMNFKYKPVLHDGKVNHDLQAQLGLMFYAGY